MAKAQAEGAVFNVHVVGSLTNKTWSGDFRAKPLLSFRDKVGVDRMRREMLGGDGTTTDAEVAATVLVVSELHFRLTEAPEWWKETNGGLDLTDPNVLREVYKCTKKVEEDYFARLEVDSKVAETKLKG